MKYEINKVKIGLAFVLFGLLFGLGMGIVFGVYEDGVKDYIAEGVAANPAVHDEESEGKIWRYAQRSHFHAMGIAAMSLGLLLLIMATSLRDSIKSLSATLIGLINLYPLSWFSMFLLAPSIGRNAAHSHLLTESLTYASIIGILSGLALLIAHIYFGFFDESSPHEDNYRTPIKEY